MPTTDPTTRRIVVELTKVYVQGQNGFVVFKGTVIESEKPEAIGKPLTCKGTCHELCIGAHYELSGKARWEEKYNGGEWQLAFSTYKVNQAATLTGLQNYLARECQHIGDGRADQIVKLYGEKTWDTLLTSPMLLSRDVVGLNILDAQEIQKWAQTEQKLAGTKKTLYQANLTTGLIKKLLETHGEQTPTVLKERAFSLTEIKGIGFLTADRLALLFGMAATNSERIEAGVLYALQETMDNQGHTCIQQHVLINAACKLLSLNKKYVIDVLKQMLLDKKLCTHETPPTEVSKYPELFAI